VKGTKSDTKFSNLVTSTLEEKEEDDLSLSNAGNNVVSPPFHSHSFHSSASKKQVIFTPDDQRRIFSEACPDIYKGSMTMMHELDSRIAEKLKKGFEEQVHNISTIESNIFVGNLVHI